MGRLTKWRGPLGSVVVAEVGHDVLLTMRGGQPLRGEEVEEAGNLFGVERLTEQSILTKL